MVESAAKRGGMREEDWVQYEVEFEQRNGLQEWQESERRVERKVERGVERGVEGRVYVGARRVELGRALTRVEL